MYTIIIPAAVVFVLVLIGFWLEDDFGIEGFGLGIFGGIISAGVVGFICLLIAIFLGFIPGTPKTEYTRIEALGDKPGSVGTFFLGCGSYGSTMYYYYVIKDGEGGYITKQASTNCHVYEDEETLPYVKIYYRQAKFAPKWSLNSCGGIIEKVEFRVPKGSVNRAYSVDLD